MANGRPAATERDLSTARDDRNLDLRTIMVFVKFTERSIVSTLSTSTRAFE
jgi:hypothetical protein